MTDVAQNSTPCGFYPYHPQRVRRLLPRDHSNRRRVCEYDQPWIKSLPGTVFLNGLNLPGMVLAAQRIHILGHRKSTPGNSMPF